jgi:hypothetical protein
MGVYFAMMARMNTVRRPWIVHERINAAQNPHCLTTMSFPFRPDFDKCGGRENYDANLWRF